MEVSGRIQSQLTVPGAKIGSAVGLMRGHGTYLDGDTLCSSLAGLIVQTNKLIRVKPVKNRLCFIFNLLSLVTFYS
jgi:exosome complex component RRP4